MSKVRRKWKERHTLRLHQEIEQAVSQLASGTGWSENEALAFIARAGWNALNAGGDKIVALRQVMTAAVAHHETEIAMRKRLAVTGEKLRAARLAAKSLNASPCSPAGKQPETLIAEEVATVFGGIQ